MVESRKANYQQVTDNVQPMIENSDLSTAASLQRHLDELKESWNQVLVKSDQEGQKLEEALANAEDLEKRFSDMDLWLTRVHTDILSLDSVSCVLDKVEKQWEQYKV